MSIGYRSFKVVSAMVLFACLFFAADVLAETIYLKDGTIVRGTVKSEDEKTILIETGDTWKRVDKSSIEMINKDAVNPENTLNKTSPAAETTVQAQQPKESASRHVTDLRLRFGSAAKMDKLIEEGYPDWPLTGEVSKNLQLDVNVGIYGQSNVGLVLSAGIFSRTHSGSDAVPPPIKIDYKASGLSLGAGIGIKANDQLHFEGKVELGTGSGNGSLQSPVNDFGGSKEAGAYGSVSIILGAYYTIDKPGLQIGFELGTQSFSGKFKYTDQSGVYTETVEGSSSTANVVVGMRF